MTSSLHVKLRLWIAMSLDGFVAGPEPSVENPLGIGGMHLHDWAFALDAWREQHGLGSREVNESTTEVEESLRNIGVTVMLARVMGEHEHRAVERRIGAPPAGPGLVVPRPRAAAEDVASQDVFGLK